MDLQINSYVKILSICVVASHFDEWCCGMEYRVGDSVWSIPPYSLYYSDWSSSHLFYIGDSLVFDFETEFSNLVEVATLDYQSCTANNPIKILNSGPATILLKQVGVFYFLCNLSNYCDLGQKISIIVQDPHADFRPIRSPSPLPVTPTVLSPNSVHSPLPVTPTALSPELSPAGGSPPSDPTRTSDQAPSPTPHLGSTNSSTNGCSEPEFILVGSCFLNVCVSYGLWVVFFLI